MKIYPTKTYYLIDYNEFDELIQKELGVEDFSCHAHYEWGHNETHETEVNRLRDGDREDVEEFMKIPESHMYGPHWGVLLGYLADHDIVPYGWYLLDVSY